MIGRARADVPAPVKAFMDHGADFVVEKDLDALVRGMNAVSGDGLIDAAELRREITARDREIANPSPRTSRSPRSTAPAPTSATA